MKGSTKNQLIAAIVVAIIATIVTWYLTNPRQRYNKLPTLVGIAFQPTPPAACSPACAPPQVCLGGACGAPPPLFSFTFSQPVDPSKVAGTMAALKSFQIDPATDPKTAAEAAGLIAALLKGGGVPFIPVLSEPTVITSNSMPAALAAQRNPRPLSFRGAGEMWFAIPMNNKAQ
jgi:hypothetical protein